jgi:hypothetical protein
MSIPTGFGINVHQQAETSGPLHTIASRAKWVLVDDISPGGSISTLATIVSGYQAQGIKVALCLNAFAWGTDIYGHARDILIQVRPDILTGPSNEPNRPDAGGRVSGTQAGTYILGIRSRSYKGLTGSVAALSGGSLDWYEAGYSAVDHDDSAQWWQDFMATGAHRVLDCKDIHAYGANIGFPNAFENVTQRAARVAAFHATYPSIPTIVTEYTFREDGAGKHGNEVTYLKGSYSAANLAALVNEQRIAMLAIPGVVAALYYMYPYGASEVDMCYQTNTGTRSAVGDAIDAALASSGL